MRPELHLVCGPTATQHGRSTHTACPLHVTPTASARPHALVQTVRDACVPHLLWPCQAAPCMHGQHHLGLADLVVSGLACLT